MAVPYAHLRISETSIPRLAKPNWLKVSSSNVYSVAYSPRYKVLYVKFKDGSTYGYTEVSKLTYAKLLGASSKGSFLHHSIYPKHHYAQLRKSTNPFKSGVRL